MKKKKAFTLIELIIVIAILALLIAIAIPKYQKSNLSAQAAAHNANVRVLKNALYSIDHPDDKEIKQDEIKPYLESGEFPKPAKALPDKNFTVTVKDGQVIVKPGPVKVGDKKLVPDNSNQ